MSEPGQHSQPDQAGAGETYPGLGRVLVIIPTYNETMNLPRILERLRTSVPNVDVLVADDNSPDGTGKLADEIADRDPAVHVMHREAKAGLGAAYLAGFDWGVEHGYDVVVEMDADGSHAPEQLPLLLDRLVDADLVLGSRWVRGGSVVNWPKRREALSRGANTYVRALLGMPVKDATAGYRAYRVSALPALELGTVSSQGYCFQVDLTWRAVSGGLRVAEVPITFVEREQGVSKMSGSIVREALVSTTRWGIAHRLGQLRSMQSKAGRSSASAPQSNEALQSGDAVPSKDQK